MNYKMRQKSILNTIKAKGSVTTNELIDEFKVSMMTIRRDLQCLENEGYIHLIHGGATWNENAILEHPMSYKQTKYMPEKRRIAEYCLSLINENDVIFIETGSTTQVIAEEIVKLNNINIYTNSLIACNTLSSFDNINLNVVPGKYRDLSYGFLGSSTIQYVKQHKFDYLFISTEGIDINFGVSTPNIEDALTKQSIIDQSKHVILVSDHSKFNKVFSHQICKLENLDMIITDKDLDDNIYNLYADYGVNIIRV